MKKIPVCRQLESNDCGPACIQMIAHYYGRKYTLTTIKSFCDITRIGLSVKDIVSCCDKIGIKAYSITINLSEMMKMPLPSILYLKRGHFVVLEKIQHKKKDDYFCIIDPEVGRVKLSKEDFHEKVIMQGQCIAIVLAPDSRFHEINQNLPNSEHKSIWNLIKDIYAKYKNQFKGIAILAFISMAINWMLPLIFRKTIDDGIALKDVNLVWVLLFSQLLFYLGYSITNSLSNFLLSKTGFKVGIELIAKYLYKIVELPVKYFDTRFNSDLIQRLNDQNRVNLFITDTVSSIFITIINLVVFSSILLYFNFFVFLIFFLSTILSYLYTISFMSKRKQIDYSLFSLDSERRNSIYETIMGMPEIKINNSQKIRITNWNKIQNKINKLNLKSIYINTFFSEGIYFIGSLKNLFVTGLCAFLVIKGDMTIGTMMTTSFLLGQLVSPVNQLLDFSRSLQDANLSYDRISDVLSRSIEKNDDKRILSHASLSQAITLESVSFKYSGTLSPWILKGIDLKIENKKITAIVGMSGSGKTTLLKLLLGFYFPIKGSILIGDENIAEINCNDWRSKCGVVMQDGYIFSGTIAENIAISEENPNIEKLKNAIKLSCLDQFISDLPMGYYTKIGESGIPISGGQKQRILIARAIYKDPEFIFLDEATNSLDAMNEKEIIDNLNDFFNNRTVVIIAHRLSTVKKADQIIVLNQGQIIERGKHSELIAQKGHYYELVKNQLELGN